MAITVKHSKVSTIPDDADTSLVRPSDWNADHTLTGTIPVVNGGTGASTANGGFNALAPSQTGNSGKYLTTDGTDTSWSTNPLGTVTSVAATAGTGISVTGSPITTSGTLNITNTAPDQTVVLTAGTGISTSGTYPNFTITNTSPSSGGTVTSVTATSPVASTGGNTPVISMPAATTSVSGYLTSTDWTTFNNKASTNAATSTVAGLIELGSDTTQTVAPNAVSTTASRSYALQVNASGQGVINVPWTDTNSGGTVTSVAALTLGTTGTDLSSSVATGTTTPVITLNVPTASAANRGVLSAADWTTFNNKGSGTVTSVTGTSPVVSSGGTTPAISMAAATTSVSGYLTSTDWNTFNGKGSGTVTSITAGTGLSGGTITTSGTIAIDSTVATLTGTQTLTNKTLTSPTLTTATTSGKFTFGGAIDETVYAVIDAAGVALSPSNGTIQTWTLGASRTPTAGTWDAGESITMMINDGTAYTITWTTLGVTWVGGSAPTLATTGSTVIELWKVGSTIYGALVGSVA